MDVLLLIKGGWMMIPVALLLLITVAVFIERIFAIKPAGKENPTFMNRIRDYIHEEKVESAINLCRMTNTPVSRMIEKGISRLGRPMNDILAAIENVRNIEIARLKKGFRWIATATSVAPLLGFLGTAVDLVHAFFNRAHAAPNADIASLSSEIYEALVPTVAGLTVGILAALACNYLKAQVGDAVNKMEIRTMEFMDLLNEPAK